jgi:hypothetical protein
MSSIWKLLAAVGRISPESYDAIFRQGPLDLVLANSTMRLAGCGNATRPGTRGGPQPSAAAPREAAVGAALVGGLLHGAIIVAGGRDHDPGRAFLSQIDDWCGTGWPRKWPRPKPKGWDQGLMFAGAALYAAHLASHYDHSPDMREALGSAADQLMGQVG